MKRHLPEEGLSEYLVQKTQAGHSCPLGPLTMPGGQSRSLLSPWEERPDLEERSTGLWDRGSSLIRGGGGLMWDLRFGKSLRPKSGLRIVSIEKGRGLCNKGAAGRNGWNNDIAGWNVGRGEGVA